MNKWEAKRIMQAELREEFLQYLDDSGVKMSWIARKLGMPSADSIYKFKRGIKPFPMKYLEEFKILIRKEKTHGVVN